MKIHQWAVSLCLLAITPSYTFAEAAATEGIDLSQIPDSSPNQFQYGVATTQDITIHTTPDKVWVALMDIPSWNESIIHLETKYGERGKRGEIYATVNSDGQAGKWVKIIKSIPGERWIGVYFSPQGENNGAEFFDFQLEKVDGSTRVIRRERHLLNRLTDLTMEGVIAKENAYYAFDGGAGRTKRELKNLKWKAEQNLPPSGAKIKPPKSAEVSPNQFRFAIAFEDSVLINKSPEQVWSVFMSPGWGELASYSITKFGERGKRGEIKAYVEKNGYPGDWSKVFKIVTNRQQISSWFDPSLKGIHKSVDGAALTDFELEEVDGGTRFTRRMYMSIPYNHDYLAEEGEKITMEGVTAKEDWYYGFEDGPARFRRDLQNLKETVEKSPDQ